MAPINPIRYRGYYWDSETKWYYLNARYYSPEWRRFISPDDTAYLDPENVNGLNLYCYCYNDPVNYCDPSGHFPWLILVAALILLTPVGGTVAQAAVSTVGYGVAASLALGDLIFYEGNGAWNDMCSIGWNPFNSDVNAVLNSNYVSFYKGVPVFRTNFDRSGSFGAIFLRREWTDTYGVKHKLTNPDEVNHERGHNSQLMMMGVANYGLMIGLPSWQEWSNRLYYDRPWEVTADVFGNVTGRTPSQVDINRGYWYLGISSLFGPLGYLFLFGEYNI